MTNQGESRSHRLLHVPTNKWLDHWIDGWYLVADENDCCILYDERNSTDNLIPMLEKLFHGRVEMFFLNALPNGDQDNSREQLKSATG